MLPSDAAIERQQYERNVKQPRSNVGCAPEHCEADRRPKIVADSDPLAKIGGNKNRAQADDIDRQILQRCLIRCLRYGCLTLR